MKNKTVNRFVDKFLKSANAIQRENSGVAAVEFALILPLMLLLYVGTMEVSIAVSVDRKLARMANTVGDLIGQSDGALTGDDVADIFTVSNHIMQPYPFTPTVVVSGVQVDPVNANEVTVAWSCSTDSNTNTTIGASTDIPSNIRSPGAFIIRTTVFLDYTPIMGFPDNQDRNSWGLSYDNTGFRLTQNTYSAPRLPAAINIETPGTGCTLSPVQAAG